ncbi:MAG TPA: hypothetical protein VIP11_16110, partial [Gemmatimonadaceae bacterium]
MSLRDRLRAVRAVLMAGVTLRALAWGVATALSLIIGAALVDLFVPLSLGVRVVLLIVAALSVFVIAVALTWRDRAVWSIPRVALWIEERFPALEYRLVTAVETGNDALVPSA